MNYQHDTHNWFFQDKLTNEVTSFSIGDVWLYFCEDILIGCMDTVTEAGAIHVYVLDERELDGKDDGYSSWHKVKADHIIKIQDEINKGNSTGFTVTTVSRALLSEKAYSLALKAFERRIDSHFVSTE